MTEDKSLLGCLIKLLTNEGPKRSAAVYNVFTSWNRSRTIALSRFNNWLKGSIRLISGIAIDVPMPDSEIDPV